MTAGLVLDVVLWLLVGLLTIAVLALARQVGVLSQRVSPAGALTPTTGPKIGELTEVLETDDLNGTRQRIGGPASERTALVLFISPTCPVCKALLPRREIAGYQGTPASGLRQRRLRPGSPPGIFGRCRD